MNESHSALLSPGPGAADSRQGLSAQGHAGW